MNFIISKGKRIPEWPKWAVVIGGIWLGLAGLVAALLHTGKFPIEPCLFKLITGIPCPTCGLSRAGWAVLHGDIFKAWLYNPLMCTILGIYGVYLLLRIISGYKLGFSVSGNLRKNMVVAVIGAAFVNWLYLIVYVG